MPLLLVMQALEHPLAIETQVRYYLVIFSCIPNGKVFENPKISGKTGPLAVMVFKIIQFRGEVQSTTLKMLCLLISMVLISLPQLEEFTPSM